MQISQSGLKCTSPGTAGRDDRCQGPIQRHPIVFPVERTLASNDVILRAAEENREHLLEAAREESASEGVGGVVGRLRLVLHVVVCDF